MMRLFAATTEEAQLHDMWWHLGQRFREGGASLSWQQVAVGLGVLLIAVGLVWALSVYLKRRERGTYRNPGSLFHDLCSVHELTSSQERLLWQLARRRFPKSPALIFLSPESFHVEAIARAAPQTQAALRGIMEKLFGHLAA